MRTVRGTKFRGRNSKHFKNGSFATDSQVCKRMSDIDPRKGTFHQTSITVGDTSRCVKGVLMLHCRMCSRHSPEPSAVSPLCRPETVYCYWTNWTIQPCSTSSFTRYTEVVILKNTIRSSLKLLTQHHQAFIKVQRTGLLTWAHIHKHLILRIKIFSEYRPFLLEKNL